MVTWTVIPVACAIPVAGPDEVVFASCQLPLPPSFYPPMNNDLYQVVSHACACCGRLVVTLGDTRKSLGAWSWEGKLIMYPSVWNMKLSLESLSALSKRCLWLNKYSSFPSCNKEQFNSGKCRIKLCKLTKRILIALLHVAGEGMLA